MARGNYDITRYITPKQEPVIVVVGVVFILLFIVFVVLPVRKRELDNRSPKEKKAKL